MKKFSFVLVLLMALLVLPFSVFADDEELIATNEEDSKKVNVYLFRGEGCPHCQEAEEWFDSIQEEYGSFFKVVDYEVWNDTDNSDLMDKVAKARKEDVEGVPYIIIGDHSWNGFTDSYKEEMVSEIKAEFEKDVDSRYDIMKLMENGEVEEEKGSNDFVVVLLIVLVVGGICYGVYKARESVN